jgi:glycosyltransferase involved in cell wall biosynthesis
MINILHLDTEGGWGGSSISLFKIIKNLDKKNFKSHVICRKKGPIINKYKKKNIWVEQVNNLYSYSAKPLINNFKLFLTTITEIIFFFNGLSKVLEIIKYKKINLIHLNFEGFFLIGFFLKILTKIPIVMHYRSTIPYNSLIHKLISYFIVTHVANYVVFISKTEKRKFFKLYPKLKKIKSEVIYNISDCKPSNINLNKKNKDLVYIGNLSYFKGVDRLIDLAEYLEKKQLKLKIKIYGETRGEFKFIKIFMNKIEKLKLKNLKLMGRTNFAERVIKNSFALLRPSRWNDPWGRDILDAFNSGIPCISTGCKNDIIVNNKNGFYVKKFNKKKVFKIIEKLYFDNMYYLKIKSETIKTKKILLDKNINIKNLESIFRYCAK